MIVCLALLPPDDSRVSADLRQSFAYGELGQFGDGVEVQFRLSVMFPLDLSPNSLRLCVRSRHWFIKHHCAALQRGLHHCLHQREGTEGVSRRDRGGGGVDNVLVHPVVAAVVERGVRARMESGMGVVQEVRAPRRWHRIPHALEGLAQQIVL